MKKEKIEIQNSKIQEYIQYCENIGIIDPANKAHILDRLSKTVIQEVTGETYGGCTIHDGDKILVKICKDQIEKECISSGMDFDKALDENIFHELTHACSILDEEIENKMKEIFSNIPNSKFPNINSYGYSILNEFVAQSISQKIVTAKYKDDNIYKKQHRIFVYDGNGHLSQTFSYEYDSDLNFYGEIEKFALDFIESLYGEKDINKFYKEHFSGQILENIKQEFESREGGIENLYLMFGNMSNIILGDYYQQGYFGSKEIKSLDNFEQSIKEFNNIVEFEINRCKSLDTSNLENPELSLDDTNSNSEDFDTTLMNLAQQESELKEENKKLHDEYEKLEKTVSSTSLDD